MVGTSGCFLRLVLVSTAPSLSARHTPSMIFHGITVIKPFFLRARDGFLFMSKHLRVGAPAKRIWDHFYGRHPRLISPEMKVDAHTVTKYVTIYFWNLLCYLPFSSGRSFLPFLRLCYVFCLYSQEGPSCLFYGFTSLEFCLLQFICVPGIRSTKQTGFFPAPFSRLMVPRRAFEFGRLLSLRSNGRSDKLLCNWFCLSQCASAILASSVTSFWTKLCLVSWRSRGSMLPRRSH